MDEIARELAEQAAAGRPLVVMNAPFDLTLLDRELRRHRASSLDRFWAATRCACWIRGSSTSTWTATARAAARSPTSARTTAWSWTDAHDAAADALASLEVVRAVGRRFAARLERLSAAELHTLQAVWHAAQARGLQAWFARSGTAEAVDPAWPLRPELPAAA